VSSSGHGHGFWVVFPILLIWFIIDFWRDILTFLWEYVVKLFQTLVEMVELLLFILDLLVRIGLFIGALYLIIRVVKFFREEY
jgi:hypothetical protein